MKSESVDKLNEGDLDAGVLSDLVVSFVLVFKESILQRFHRNETSVLDKKFTEFILVEAARALYGDAPVSFYERLNFNDELSEALGLKHLDDLEEYEKYDRKRKKLKKQLKSISRRNLKTSGSKIFALDTVIVEMDVNKLRSGKKVKEGLLGSEFMHSSSKGTVVGVQIALLVNITKFSLEKIDIYSKRAAKKRIWKEMVIDKLGTYRGKIKKVIADAGFFAYDNYTRSVKMRIKPIIKIRSGCEDKLEKKLKNVNTEIEWFDKVQTELIDELMEDFKEIIKSTINESKNYDELKKTRGEIEQIFKAAKMLFGMKNFHVYDKEKALTKSFVAIYVSTIFYQFLKINQVNHNRAIPLLAQRRDLW
ncbi:hypothetical protein AKJ38_00695 [candidate division MSBL1 archaeon SCGC-AAA259I14]|uniref:Transposase IS4-like domain-containing protein n=2 Tax=candidate division MSBL1 TaxID=215777 RepID=A0A133UTR8_9EURY|nr:hypothetical protein AKJ66_02000 [candidate division MSBL1 archaeon SCGC-AAA259E22]KXA97612.1 hypothetical protein AKJ38_00695 [candidate division MSBL1 archaeon SCGC-AAA259I14]